MLRAAVPRWTAKERNRRIAEAPPFRYPSPGVDQLAELARRYTEITGDPIRREKKRNFLAACWRVHGDDTLLFIADEFARTGKTTNLLGIVRCSMPRSQSDRRDSGAMRRDWPTDELRTVLGEDEDQSLKRSAPARV